MKEQVLDTLKELGFEVEEAEGLGYVFEYEGLNYVYMHNPNDENFLNIALPAVMEYDEKDRETFFELMDQINSTLMYIKAYVNNGDMWLFYERELMGDEDMMPLLRRMILRLEAGINFLRKAQKNQDDGNEDEDALEVTDDDTDTENDETPSQPLDTEEDKQ